MTKEHIIGELYIKHIELFTEFNKLTQALEDVKSENKILQDLLNKTEQNGLQQNTE